MIARLSSLCEGFGHHPQVQALISILWREYIPMEWSLMIIFICIKFFRKVLKKRHTCNLLKPQEEWLCKAMSI